MRKFSIDTIKLVSFILAGIIILVSLTACLIGVTKAAEKSAELKRIERLTAPLFEEKRQILRELENFDRLMMMPVKGGATMT